MASKKNTGSWKFFVVAFLIMIAFMFISKFTKKGISLSVPDNKGVSFLSTMDSSLVAGFYDGQICIWNWNDLSAPYREFKVPRSHITRVNEKTIAFIPEEQNNEVSIYDIEEGKEIKTIEIGQQQHAFLRTSRYHDEIVCIFSRQKDSKSPIYYQFSLLDIENEMTGFPTEIVLKNSGQSLIDFAIDRNKIAYAVGSDQSNARLIKMDLVKRQILLDQIFQGISEFCSVVISKDNTIAYAGNRDGFLYKINLENGQIEKEIALLEKGETRPTTNSLSVLSPVVDQSGRYLACTIDPIGYVIDTQNHEVILKTPHSHKVLSKIVFSPDLKYIATSDIRASGRIVIHEFKNK